jgi:hypothetical protein
MDQDPVQAPDPDPTPDPTPFFIDFKDAKKNLIIFIFFLITYPQAHHVQSNLVLKCFSAAIISVRSHNCEKREGSGAGSGSVPLTNGSGSRSGRPKNIRIRIPNTGSQFL